jgi:hypothetical protein
MRRRAPPGQRPGEGVIPHHCKSGFLSRWPLRGPLLPERFSRCCPQPGYRSDCDQGRAHGHPRPAPLHGPSRPQDAIHDIRAFHGDREHRQPPRVAQPPRHAEDHISYRETKPNQRKNRSIRRAAGVSVPAVAGAVVPRSRIRSLSIRWKFSPTSAAVGASVPRPHATSPKPAAPAHSARARCRRPAAQCPAPAAAWITTGATEFTHPDVVEGLAPSRWDMQTSRSKALLSSSRAIPALSRVCANTRRSMTRRAAHPREPLSANGCVRDQGGRQAAVITVVVTWLVTCQSAEAVIKW